MPQTVLITGVAGFIGSHLAERLLARGDRVVGVDAIDTFYDPARKRDNLDHIAATARRHGAAFEFSEHDIRDRAALERLFAGATPDACAHIAALAGVRPSIERPTDYADVNITGTSNVLHAMTRAGTDRLAFASSSSVYGNNTKVPFAETDPVDHPISPYAATKRAAELVCHAHAHLHGTRTACLRFFTVFGPRQRPDLAIQAFMERALRGEPIPVFGSGEQSRDFTYVDDIVDGLVAAIDRTPAFEILNLGGSSPVSLNHLIGAIEDVIGTPMTINRQDRHAGDVERTYADLTRSKAVLGYEPRVPLVEGLRRQWAWAQSALGVTP